MTGKITRHWPWIVVITAWGADEGTAWLPGFPQGQDRVIGALAVVTTIWAMWRLSREPKQNPDKIVLSTPDYLHLVETLDKAARARLSKENDGGGGCASRLA